jgi:hypothetical protein
VSLWLNSGVPATEVARRAGHGVAVLLKIYAHCIDGQATAANQRIAEALGTQDAEEDPVTRATATSSRHPEMAGQSRNLGESGLRNRSRRARPWPFPSSSVGWSVAVRGPVRACPWPVPPRFVDRTDPKPGAHGRIAAGGRPKSRLEAHNRRSAT